MNILYLHGLKSKLNAEKRKILAQYGEVYAPDINYEAQHIQPAEILKQYPEVEFNVVIGSSMGALNSYIISETIGRPCLLFNPPLAKYVGPYNIHTHYQKINSFKQIILGGIDDVVDPKETLSFLSDRLTSASIDIHIDPRLGHRIPLELFKAHTESFFSKLCY